MTPLALARPFAGFAACLFVPAPPRDRAAERDAAALPEPLRPVDAGFFAADAGFFDVREDLVDAVLLAATVFLLGAVAFLPPEAVLAPDAVPPDFEGFVRGLRAAI